MSDFYEELVAHYKKNHDKSAIVDKMIEFCKKETTTPENVYNLKKKMEIQFVSDVHCRSVTSTFLWTNTDSGCDLREMLYNIDGELIPNGQKLLDLFEKKKLREAVWHIVTDIDDTLYAHSAHGVAGKDESWFQKQPYPGIKAFYTEFYTKVPKESQYSTVLSATPGFLKVFKINSPNALNDILGEFGFIQGMDRKREVLTAYLRRTAYSTFGEFKFNRFMQYTNIFPEYKFLFIGDNGQGDVLAGKEMIARMPKGKCYVFIHDVYSDGQYESERNGYRPNERIYLFNNYYDLAKIFRKIGIFKDYNVSQIRKSVVRETDRSEFKALYTSAFRPQQSMVRTNSSQFRPQQSMVSTNSSQFRSQQSMVSTNSSPFRTPSTKSRRQNTKGSRQTRLRSKRK